MSSQSSDRFQAVSRLRTYLSNCQDVTLNLEVILDLRDHRREGDSVTGQAHDILYLECKPWAEGGSIVCEL